MNGLTKGLDPTQVGSVGDAAKAMRWLRQGTARVRMANGAVQRELTIGQYSNSSPDQAAEILQVLEDFAAVVKGFDLRLEAHAIGAEELLEQSDRLKALALIAKQSRTDVVIKGIIGRLPEQFRVGERCAILLTPWLRVGRTTLVAATAIIGRLTVSDQDPEQCEVRCDKLLRLASRVTADGCAPPMTALCDEAEATLNHMGVKNVYRR
jgi:hypothetical protein